MSAPSATAREHVSSGSRPFRALLREGLVVFALIVALGLLVNGHIVFAPRGTYPGPADQLGHLTRVWYLGDTITKTGRPGAWFPFWYSGSATYQYYPPLPSVLMTIFQLLLNDVTAVYKVIVLLFPAIGGLGAYYFGKRLGGFSCGSLTAVLFAFHPYNLRTLTMKGNFAQAAVAMVGPYALLLAIRTVENGSRASWVLSCLTWALMILGHPMSAAIFAVGIVVFTGCLCIADRKLAPIVTWLASVFVGLLLTGFWTVPGVTRLENSRIPYLLPERAMAQSVSWYIFNPFHRYVSTYPQYFSAALTALAVLGLLIAMRSSRGTRLAGAAIGVSLLVSLVISFGNNTPLFEVMPLATQIVPDRILNYASILQCGLASLAISHVYRRIRMGWRRPSASGLGAIVVAALLMVVYVDCRPYMRLGGMYDYALLRSFVARVPHDGADPFSQGRLSIITYDWVSAANYFPAIERIGLIDGWNQEGTTHQEVMVEQNIAASYGFWRYHLRNYSLRNVRSVIAREDQEPEFVALLRQDGFYEAYRDSGISLYLSDKPSTYAFDMTDSMLAVGRGSLWASTALPWIVRGRNESLLAHDPEFLDAFPVIFVDEPALDPGPELERAIRRLVKDGKTVIVDLSNSPVRSLFGVTSGEMAVSGETTFVGATGSAFPSSQVLNTTRTDGGALRGAVYDELDGVLLSLRFEGEDYPVVGYRDVPEGRVFFVGMGSTRSVIDTKNEGIAGIFLPLFETLAVRKTISPPAFEISTPVASVRGVSFRYSSPESKPVLLSVTYTQRWTTKIDGKPVPTMNLEDFVFLDLPAGAHHVTLEYGMSWVGLLGLGVTAFGVLLTVICALTWYRGLGKLSFLMQLAHRRIVEWSEQRVSV